MKTALELINEAEAEAEAFVQRCPETTGSQARDRLAFRVGWLEASLRQMEFEHLQALARRDAQIERLRIELRAREAEDDIYRLDHIERQLDERDRARDINATLR